MNEDMYRHQTFLVLADYLTRHGVAVLRADKRGIGESKGSFLDALTRISLPTWRRVLVI